MVRSPFEARPSCRRRSRPRSNKVPPDALERMSLHAARVGKDMKVVSSGRRKTSSVSRETATPRRYSTGTEVHSVHSVKEGSRYWRAVSSDIYSVCINIEYFHETGYFCLFHRSRKTACEGSLPPIVFERSPQQGTKRESRLSKTF